MLSVDEALQHVLARATPRPAAECDTAAALGLVLAEQVASDVDSPPHDKSIVDGYAVLVADLATGTAELELLEEITAGQVPSKTVVRGTTSRIMTGAPIPPGADAVIMIEQSELAGTRVRLTPPRVTSGQNILRRAVSMARGDVVLERGHELRAIELGLLAEVGRTRVRAIPRPRLAVLSTGNELVPPGELPAAGQIRNSNGPMLLAAARAAGAECIDLGIALDDGEMLRQKIGEGLRADVLVLSGGVSAGVLDLVPGVLAELGVEPVFHKVRLKPGKPLWFGVLRDAAGDKLVFGLPGNPVSSLVGFELFVRPAVARLAGRSAAMEIVEAVLAAEFSHRGDRPTYHPAELRRDGQIWHALPLRWQGSADLRTLARANALVQFPPGEYRLEAGSQVLARRLA